MERFAQQDAAQKVMTEQLAALTYVLAPLTGNIDAPTTTIRIQLFNTDRTDGTKNETISTRNPVTVGSVHTPDGPDLETI